MTLVSGFRNGDTVRDADVVGRAGRGRVVHVAVSYDEEAFAITRVQHGSPFFRATTEQPFFLRGISISTSRFIQLFSFSF